MENVMNSAAAAAAQNAANQWLNGFTAWERFLIKDWIEKIVLEGAERSEIIEAQTHRWWEWLAESEGFNEFWHFSPKPINVVDFLKEALASYIQNIMENENFEFLLEEYSKEYGL
jgi:hypothetical protein